MKKLLLLLCLTVSFSSAAEKPKWKLVKPDTPENVTLHENLECSKAGDFSVLVNVYVPKKEGAYPAILLIHGGGWQKRQIEPDKPMAERLAQRGYVVTQVAYRLSTDAKYPAALHDCKAALRFMRANAEKYQIDPRRIGVMGGSAGGHLSGLVGMTGDVKSLEGAGGNPDQPTPIKACVVMAATMDLLEANKKTNSEGHVLFFGPISENRPLYAEASPIEYAGKSSPPTLFIEGEKDNLKIGRAEMQEKLKAAGIPTELVTLKDAPHPFWMSQPWLDETVKAAGDWFDKYL